MIELDQVEDTGRINLPSDVYSVRILDAEKRDSSKGNPMLVLSLEIAAPDTIKVGEGVARIAGLRFSDYIMLSDRGLGVLKKLHKLLELPMSVNTDALPVEGYRGKALVARVRTEVEKLTRPGTQEPVLNPETGTPIEDYTYRIREYVSRHAALDKAVAF